MDHRICLIAISFICLYCMWAAKREFGMEWVALVVGYILGALSGAAVMLAILGEWQQ